MLATALRLSCAVGVPDCQDTRSEDYGYVSVIGLVVLAAVVAVLVLLFWKNRPR